jgi:uncharacterized protein YqgV (UPF0045/DUF77 family)
MQRISLPYIYELAASLKPLAAINENTTINQYMYVLYKAEQTLETFLYQSVYTTSLKATIAPGSSLLQVVKKLTSDVNNDRVIGFIDAWNVKNGLTQFETVLTAEWASLYFEHVCNGSACSSPPCEYC